MAKWPIWKIILTNASILRLLVPGAKSVVSLLLNYYTDEHQVEGAPKISKYAYGTDYHFVIKGKA